MVRKFFTLAIALILGTGVWNCGVNTEQPLFPIYTFSIVGPPAIVEIRAVETLDPLINVLVEFDLDYYLTNTEDGFLGYNLYIRTSNSSAEAQLSGLGGTPYLPDGIEPSFAHVGQAADTKNRITQRITHEIPHPAGKVFEPCEKYFFRLTAIIRTGVQSRPSPEVGACAAADPLICPAGTPCNPAVVTP